MTDRHRRYDGAIALRFRLGLLFLGSAIAIGVALLALLRQTLPRCVWRYRLAVTTLSLALVATMEAYDAAVAGRPCGDMVALFGGSLLLAIAVAASVAALVTLIVRASLLGMTALQGVIVAIVAAFIRIAFPGRSLSHYDRRNGRSIQARIALRGHASGERAPPLFLRSSFS